MDKLNRISKNLLPKYFEKTQTFISTANQSIFVLTNGSFTPNNGEVEIHIEGSRQQSGENYTEINSTTIMLAEELPAGRQVDITWRELKLPTANHAGNHKAGGVDALNVKDLDGFQTEVLDKIKNTIIRPEDFGAAGDGIIDDSTSFMNAITAANGRQILCDKEYKISLTLTDEHINLIGNGTLVQQQAKSIIDIKRTLGSPITVTSVSTVQIGSNNPAIGVPTETSTKIIVSGSLVGINQGDLYHISSEDLYPFCTQMTINKGTTIQVWKAGFVPVHGIGLDYSGAVNGGFTENDIVTGVTSGATGLILSKSDNVLVFKSISGNFINGENLQVSGTVKGVAASAPYIIMAGRLIDSYSTNIKLRKVPTDKKFIINGLRVKADGDVDSIVGKNNRKAAFWLRGVYNPTIKNFTVESAWNRAFRLDSCYHGDLDVFIKKLPNNANSTEEAYGYGVELLGATEGCKVRVNGGNCRHGFTTNVSWMSVGSMSSLLLQCGTVKFNKVYDSQIEGAISASFDTHEGAYYTMFENCRSITSRSGLRNITGSAGFQNRGFGTVYKDCYDRGSVVGFIEQGTYYEADFIHTIRYENCIAENFQQFGFQQMNDSANDNNRLELINFTVSGDGSAINNPYYQVGYYFKTVNATLQNCKVRRFTGAPFQFVVSGGHYDVMDCYADYTDCPTNTTGLRFDGSPATFNLYNYRYKSSNTVSNSPTAAIRVASGSVFINSDGIICINKSANPAQAQVTGGTLTITRRNNDGSIKPTNYVGDAGLTVAPGDFKTTIVYNTPLTTDRTITLGTVTGILYDGYTISVTRTAAATGAFNLNVGSNKVLATPGTWCEVVYNGNGGWTLTKYGSL